MDFIDHARLEKLATRMGNSSYSRYLLSLVHSGARMPLE